MDSLTYLVITFKYVIVLFQDADCYLANINYLEDSVDNVTFFMETKVKDSINHYCAGGM